MKQCRINNTSFSLWLTNRPNKLDCFTTLGWNIWQGTNTLAYWAHWKVMMNTVEGVMIMRKLFMHVISKLN